jgi:hypothetical protein
VYDGSSFVLTTPKTVSVPVTPFAIFGDNTGGMSAGAPQVNYTGAAVVRRHTFPAAGSYTFNHQLNSADAVVTCRTNSGANLSGPPVNTDANNTTIAVSGASDQTCSIIPVPPAVLDPSSSAPHQTLVSQAAYSSVPDINALGFTDWYILNGSGNQYPPALVMGTRKAGGNQLKGIAVPEGVIFSFRPPGWGKAPSIGWTGGDAGGSGVSPLADFYLDANIHAMAVTAPAGPVEHTLSVYLGFHNNAGQIGTATCHISDSSTPDLQVTWSPVGGGANNYDPYLLVIRYAAASENQTYTCTLDSTLHNPDAQAVGVK